MWEAINSFLTKVDDFVWGPPLMILIIAGGILLTIRMGVLQVRKLPLALKWMVKNEEEGEGEVTSFGALCTALSATIGTGNIVGVATAIGAGGPGALFWMVLAAFFGMATKYAEGLLAVKYRVVDEDNHALGGPFYYIEKGMGTKWKWLAKIFAFFGICVGLFGIGTFSQVNGIASAVEGFFDPNESWSVEIPGIGTYSWTVVIASLILSVCVALVLIGGIKRIANVSQIVVPFMAVLYVLLCLVLLICNIKEIPDETALNLVLGMRPVTFKFKDSDQRSMGLIAQELDALQKKLGTNLPLVDHSEEYLSIPYGNNSVLFAGAIKAQQKEIKELEKALKEIKEAA